MTADFTRLLLTGAAMMSGLSGCYYYDCPETADARYYQDPAYVEVQTAPPPIRAAVAVRPTRPAGNALWVDGHYVWRGSWVWVDGHWETPRAGYVWTAPTVVQAGGNYRYHPGYWRPRATEAAPVYRQPSTVAVSVRPRGTTTVRQGGGTQTVTVQGGATATQGGTGTATVQSGGNTQGTNGTVQGGTGTTTVQGGTRTTVSPGTRTTTTVQGGVRTTDAPGTRTTTVQGGTRTTVQPGTRTTNVQGGTRTTVSPGTRATTATVQGGTRTTVSPGTRTVDVGGTGNNAPGTVALTCRINTQRAPRGGYITVSGTGFGSRPTVMIGGNIAAVSASRGGAVRAQVPRDSSGGRVTLRQGNRTASCGTLDIAGR